MSANPHANGGLLRRELVMPDFADYAVKVATPGQADGEATRIMGVFLRDVMKRNAMRNFRLFGPDETASNRLSAGVRGHRPRLGRRDPARGRPSGARRPGHGDPQRAYLPGLARRLSADRPARSVLCYEAFIHIVDSMFNQHAKWLKSRARDPVAAADRVA